MIQILPVSKENEEMVLNLHVKKEQKNFIETTAQCLQEATELHLWRPVGVYNDTELIGFAMYGCWKEEGICGRVWLDRFLIDESCQGRGYGKMALKVLLLRIWEEYDCNEIFLSLYKENTVAAKLYQSFGFYFNGEEDIHGEKVMVLKRLINV